MPTYKWVSGFAILAVALATSPRATSAAILLHVDANDLTLNDGELVSAWGPLVQAAEPSQPTFRTTAMNGNKAVDFETSQDFMQAGAVPGALSIVAVAKFVDGPNLAGLVSNDNDRFNVRRNGTTSFYRSVNQSGDNNDFYRHGGHPGDNVYVDAVGSGAFVTGTSHVVISNATAPADFTTFTVGRASASLGRYWGGEVSEMYVLDQTLTQDEIIGISSILAEKWGSTPVSATPEQRAAGAAAIPEPSALGLAAAAAGALGLRRRGRRATY